MTYEVIKLRELFPALNTKPLDELKAERDKARDPKNPLGWPEYREPTLTAYVPDVSPEVEPERRRASVLICPGGGYHFVSFREAEPVAVRFLSRGFNVFVLDYEVAPVRYPVALLEAAAAMNVIRSRAAHFHADPDKIAIGGFSAGGHLAASLSVFWQEKFISDALGVPSDSFKPNALILGYPVITSGPFAHRNSFINLLGADAPEELVGRMSLENQVNPQVPPTFMWHTFSDEAVPVENSLMFAKALRENNVPFEMHIFPQGAHGLSLCNDQSTMKPALINPHCEGWPELCEKWLQFVFG
jgi:acetyl esterase/lipase